MGVEESAFLLAVLERVVRGDFVLLKQFSRVTDSTATETCNNSGVKKGGKLF